MKKNTVSAVRRFFNSVVNRRQVVESRVSAPKVRLLRLEGLEDRELLDASPIVSLANAAEIACVATLDHEEEFEAIDLSDAVTPTTWVVTSTADDESVGTLRYILAQAEDDDTITFDESLKGETITLNGTQLAINKSITIDASNLYDSESQTPGITIDGNAQSRVFLIDNMWSVSIKGLAITNGKTANGGGGGVWVGEYTSAYFSDCVITNNAGGSGGGVCVYGGYSSVEFTNCAINNNTASSNGGGVYLGSGKSGFTYSFTNCEINNNTSSSSGGGVYSSGITTYTDCEISNNKSSSHGGGIYCSVDSTYTNCTIAGNTTSTNWYYDGGGIYSSGTSAYMSCTITGNTSTHYGGGIYCSSNASYYNCIIAGNKAMYNNQSSGGGIYSSGTAIYIKCAIDNNTTSGYGGGIYCNNKADYTNCKITSNTASYSGGGIYSSGVASYTTCAITDNKSNLYGGGIYSSANKDYLNCTIAGNKAESYSGGGIYNNNGTSTLYNSIVALNSASNGDDLYRNGGGVVAYNTLSAFSEWSNPSESGVVNFLFDGSKPLFNSGFVLARNSQAINKGDNQYVTEPTDLAGKIRIVDGIVDLGVYEDQTAAPKPLTTPIITTVIPSETELFVSWQPVPNASGYTLQYKYADSSEWGTLPTVDATETSYSVSGLNPGTTYNLRLQANGSDDYTDSNYSDVVSYSTQQRQLTSPTLIASDSTTTSISVNWNTVTNASGYTLQYKPTNSETWSTVSEIPLNQTSYTIASLDPGTTYNLRLQANGSGAYSDSDYSEIVRFSTKKIQLTTPSLSATSATETSITVRWNSIANASGYVLQFRQADSLTWTSTSTLDAELTSCTLSSLVPGTTYALRLQAKGVGAYSDSNYSSVITYSTKSESEMPWIIVTTTEDVVDPTGGLISLREALAYATSGETVTFVAALAGQIITVDSELLIDKSVSIDGGESKVTLCGSGTSRVIRFLGADSDEYTLANLTITGGSNTHGAGVYVATGVANIVNSSIVGNTATTSGGGLYVAGKGAAKVTNTLIADNSAKYGGGVYSYGTAGKAVVFTNCTITNNTATSSGSGLHTETANGIVEIYNSIIALNIGKSDVGKKSSGRVVTAYHTLSSFGAWTSGAQNVVYSSSRPLFTDVAQGDYSLAPGSQAINLGDASYVVGAVDLAGNPRIVGASVDLGAFEYQSSVETPSLIVTTLSDVVDATDGLISLREAIAYAGSGDTITFDSALRDSTIVVNSELLIEKSLTIDGGGAITLSGRSGGGTTRVLRFLGGESAEYTIIGLTITGGSHTHGAGVYVATGTANIVNCSIVGNTSTTSGGGLYVAGKGAVNVVNTLIANNSAKYGGGVYSYGGAGNEVVLTNCTIANNKATASGAGLHMETANGTVSIRNSIVALNVGAQEIQRKTNARVAIGVNTLSTFTAWSTGSVDTLQYDGTQPLFVNASQGDFTLTSNSQALNCGNNDFLETEFDLAGAERVVGGKVDLGAYELQITSEQETPSVVVTTVADVVDPTDGLISLREALAYAEPGDAVTFDASLAGQTLTLSSELLVEKELSIDGESHGITLSGGGHTRVVRFLGSVEDEYALRNLTITGGVNTHGAGVYVATGAVNIVNCTIIGNKSTTSGGGIYVAGKGEATIVNTLVANNSAKYGGGVYCYGATDKAVLISNSTIANNSATSSGSGLHLETANGTLEIRNSIIALNTGKTDVYKKSTGRSIKAINTLSTYTAWTSGKNNLLFQSALPLFTDVSTSDFTLAASSQALDKGSTASVISAFDLSGSARIVGGKVDLGAYERQADASNAIIDKALAELFIDEFETL